MSDLRYADHSERGKLRFTGPQRAWFLHQIVTRSFEDIAEGESRPGAMLTAKGRMVGFFEAVATDDAILMHYDESLRATFPDEFRRYIFATEVEIEDVTDSLGLFLVVGDGWNELAEQIPGAIKHPTSTYGAEAGHLWVEGEARATIEAAATPIDEAELEALRIDAGMPRWGKEMNDHSIPQEARLEEFGALDFDKGCYVGQETVAKVHFRGRVNKKVRRIEADDNIEVGDEVSVDGESIGAVTSAAGAHGLALLKYTVEPGDRVTVGTTEATVLS